MNVQTSNFKYYLHDSVEACRLQLLGPFASCELKELTGCWNTAKTTLEVRKLIVDVSAVTSLDDAARKWIAAMVAEGALLVEAPSEPARRMCQNGIFKRMIGALLGVNAESPTGAQ